MAAWLDEGRVRTLARWLGIATVAFGIPTVAVPCWFARVFGFAAPESPTVAAAYRSVGMRDLATGMGLWSAAAHGGNYAPWLLARAIVDSGDTVAGLIALGRGERNARFIALTA